MEATGKIAQAGMVHEVDALKASHAEPTLDGPGYWYLATPYSKYPRGIHAAFLDACQAAGRLIQNGVKVFSSIGHTHPIAMHNGMDPLSHELWMPADKPLMDGAHGLLVVEMAGWNESRGVSEEIAHFKAAGKPVVRLSWPALNVTGSM